MKAPIAYAGSIGMTEYGWLHIELNNLLPHCRFSTPEYLHDMTAGRPYQKAISRQQALRTISEGAGNQFDPILAGLFCAAQRNA